MLNVFAKTFMIAARADTGAPRKTPNRGDRLRWWQRT